MKTIFIQIHGVAIILIVASNMSCINLLTPTHNLSVDRKFGCSPTCSFEILLAFDMEFGMTFVDHEDS